MTTPRRSERIRKNEDLERDVESAGVVGASRRKRQKIEVEQESQVVRLRRPDVYVRGRRGHLEFMVEMPIDTLYEIFRQLDPLDLLYLSWASKSLRDVVMDKSAGHIWEEAYERLSESKNPPPRCPEDVDFARYTRFLYYNKCMLCGVRNGPHTCWMLRLRVCSHCLKNSNRFVIVSEHDAFLNNVNGGWCFVIDTKQDFFMLASDGGNTEERLRLSDIEQEKRTRLQKGQRKFDAWTKRCFLDHSNRKRAKRQAAIFKKLKEIGWDESYIREINKGRLPDDLPGFKSTKTLTKKDWKDIRPQIEESLNEMKNRHLDRLKSRRFVKRWNNFNAKFKEWDQMQTLDSSFRPHPADIAALEPFRTIIFTSDTEEAEFKINDIDRVAKDWVGWRDNIIFSLLPQDLQDRYQANKLSLQPLPIFRFSSPSLNNVTLDRVCAKRERMGFYMVPTPAERKIYEALVRAKLDYVRPWQEADLRFDIKGHEYVISILEFLGMDPYATTSAEMAECREECKCSLCDHLPPFKCEGMIRHDWYMHYAEVQEQTPLATRWIRLENGQISGSHSL